MVDHEDIEREEDEDDEVEHSAIEDYLAIHKIYDKSRLLSFNRDILRLSKAS